MSEPIEKEVSMKERDKLTIANRPYFGTTFKHKVDTELLSRMALDVANGTKPFPIAVGALDPTGLLPMPPMPAPNAGNGVWQVHRATADINKNLEIQRAEWNKVSLRGVRVITDMISDEIMQLEQIRVTLGSLPRLYAAIRAYVDELRPGDNKVRQNAFDSFKQEPDELVEAYTARFQRMVAEMADRGLVQAEQDQRNVYAAGLHFQGAQSLEQLACSGATLEILTATAISMEALNRSKTVEGDYGSAHLRVATARSTPYSAMTVMTGRSNGASSSNACYVCGQEGHHQHMCPHRPPERRGQGTRKRQRIQGNAERQRMRSSAAAREINTQFRNTSQRDRGSPNSNQGRWGGRTTVGGYPLGSQFGGGSNGVRDPRSFNRGHDINLNRASGSHMSKSNNQRNDHSGFSVNSGSSANAVSMNGAATSQRNNSNAARVVKN